jgi:hypothetical protein
MVFSFFYKRPLAFAPVQQHAFLGPCDFLYGNCAAIGQGNHSASNGLKVRVTAECL